MARIEVDTVTNNLRFPGQYFDAETGLHYNLHRFYDANSGRYLRLDLIEHRFPGNYYSYANANPANLIDSLGLVSTTQVIGGLGGAFIGGAMGYAAGAAVGVVGTFLCGVAAGPMALGCVAIGASLAPVGGVIGSIVGTMIGISCMESYEGVPSDPRKREREINRI
ncbi:MAG: RHS repeat-associated core domain-containing protein [bacterium]|nr:RHS repeat-associated core domain-containing protein [bacterium]